MSFNLEITNAGKAKEIDALVNGAAIPKFHKLVIGSGVAVTTPSQIAQLTQLVNKVYEIPINKMTRTDPVTLKIEATIPDDVEILHLSEIGLTLEDGTLFAYTPYMANTPDGGGTKARGFSLHLITVLSRQQSGEFNLVISPLDSVAIAQEIAGAARQLLDENVANYLISVIMTMGYLQQQALLQQDQINGLKLSVQRLTG
jgi:phage-related tail fiber protein